MAAAFSMPQRENYKPARVPSIEEHHKLPSSFDGYCRLRSWRNKRPILSSESEELKAL
jgi:hypothetical protein